MEQDWSDGSQSFGRQEGVEVDQRSDWWRERIQLQKGLVRPSKLCRCGEEEQETFVLDSGALGDPGFYRRRRYVIWGNQMMRSRCTSSTRHKFVDVRR